MGLHAIVCMEGGVSNLAVVIKPQGRQGAAWLQTFVYVLGGALGAVIGRTAASLLPYDAEWLTDLATLVYDLWYACPDVSLGCDGSWMSFYGRSLDVRSYSEDGMIKELVDPGRG